MWHCLLHPMQTYSSSKSPPHGASDSSQCGQHSYTQTPNSGGDSVVEKHGQWTIQENRELIGFLSNCRAEAEDGANFKQAVWTQAATHMSTLHPNIAFNATQCSSKWGRVHCFLSLWYLLLTTIQQLKDKFTIVHRLKEISGLGNRLSDAKGMNIDLQMKDQWDAIVQVDLILMHWFLLTKQ